MRGSSGLVVVALLVSLVTLAIQLASDGLPSWLRASTDASSNNKPTTTARPTRIVHDVPAIFGRDELLAKYDASVVNDTNQRIRFTDIRTSCGCSKADLETRDLDAGQSTTLHVEVNMTRNGGRRQVSCILKSDTGRHWYHVFNLVAYPELQFQRNMDHVSFGEIDPGASAEKSVEIHLHAPGKTTVPPKLTAVESDSEDIDVSLSNDPESSVLEDGTGTRRKAAVLLRLRAQSDAGAKMVSVRVRYEGPSAQAEKVLSVAWIVRPAYEISPKRIYLRLSDEDTRPIKRSVVVRRLDGEPLEVSSVEAASPHVSVAAVRPVEKDRQRIEFEIDPRSIDGVLYATAVVRTNHPLQPMTKVVISGRRPDHDAPTPSPGLGQKSG